MLNKRLGEDASAFQCPNQRRTRTGGGKLCKYFLNLNVLHQFFSWTQTDIFVSCYDLCSVLGVLQGEDTTVDVDDDEWDQTLCYCVNIIQELDCPNKINGEVSSGIKHELCNDSFYC